jgi:hypothetical protein
LPVRFSATDTTADGRLRDVELHRERVVLRRSVRGMRMALNMPIAAFDGVSLSLLPREGAAADILAVMLKHSDPGARCSECLAAREKAFGFSLDCASGAVAHKTATPAASPSERTEGSPAAYSPSARVWQDYRGDARSSRRARDHRSKLTFTPLQLQGAAFHDQFDMVGIHFPQNVRRVAGTDLSCGEFVDDAIARWTFRGDRAIAVAGHAAIAVGALVSDKIADPFADAVDRAFFRICALAPSTLDRIGLCQCRQGKDAVMVRMGEESHQRRQK